MPDLFERFRVRAHSLPQVTPKTNPNGPREISELERILNLPLRMPLVRSSGEQRTVDPLVELYAKQLEAKLKKPNTGPCECGERFRRRCAEHLLPIQAWALKEIEENGGLLGAIGVGDGKTLLDLLTPLIIPNCKTAVLLVQPNLRHQLTEVDWAFYGQHWQLPNLAIKGPRWGVPGRPWLHVVAFTELSSAKSTDLLERINADTIIIDEAQNLASDSSRTKRFARYVAAHPEVRVCAWSGTLTKRSLRDYAHIAAATLKAGSPCPRNKNDVESWCEELDPCDGIPPPPSKLSEKIGDWNKRLTHTAGVISSPESLSCSSAIYFQERKVEVPQELHSALAHLEAAWERPDGEELVTALEMAKCRSELALGFFYRWRWPTNIELAHRKAWLGARAAWHKEMRGKLQHSKEFMDSPLLLKKAAERWHYGYTHENVQYPPRAKSGPLPTWPSLHLLAWEEQDELFKRTFNKPKPDTEPVWITDALVEESLNWARQNIGIVWYEHTAFADRIRAANEFTVYGGGSEASEQIASERGNKTIFASIAAHGTGKHLQMFNKNLVSSPPGDGAVWEQLMGRSHRQGQLADEVWFYVYRHVNCHVEALEKARGLAGHIQGTWGGTQRLLRATYLW